MSRKLDRAERSFPAHHYCFRVGDSVFDGIVARISRKGIGYKSTPHGPVDLQVNIQYGGRNVYCNEPEGHVWEILTVSYVRQHALG